MRLFVAITPPEEAVEDLDTFLEARREAGSGLRWVPPSQWHLTLAFCPAFPPHRLDELEERLARAARRRRLSEVCLKGGGAFPDAARARVLWLGLECDRTEIERLATGARAAVAKAGGAVDGQRFRAHLTLARMGRPIEATRWLRVLEGYCGPSWAPDGVDLIASYLGEGEGGRPRYETIGRFPLGVTDDK